MLSDGPDDFFRRLVKRTGGERGRCGVADNRDQCGDVLGGQRASSEQLAREGDGGNHGNNVTTSSGFTGGYPGLSGQLCDRVTVLRQRGDEQGRGGVDLPTKAFKVSEAAMDGIHRPPLRDGDRDGEAGPG